MSPLTIDAPVERPDRTRPPGDRLPPLRPPEHGDGDDGAPQPSRPLLDNVRLGMLFFLSAETMLFAAFVSGFFVLRLAAPQWPPPLQPRLPVIVTGINTFILATSSAALIIAELPMTDRCASLAWRIAGLRTRLLKNVCH